MWAGVAGPHCLQAWPPAGLLACASAFLQVRCHAKALCTLYQRPKQEGCRGIGPWRGVFVALGCAAVASNCGLLFFTSNLFTTCKDCPTGWAAPPMLGPGPAPAPRAHARCEGLISQPSNSGFGTCAAAMSGGTAADGGDTPSSNRLLLLAHGQGCELSCAQNFSVSGVQPSCNDGLLTLGSVRCVPNVDCSGNWTECAADCSDKLYIVAVERTGSGAECEAPNGTQGTCFAGDGGCTGSCTTRGPPLYPQDTTCGDHGSCDPDLLVCRCEDGYTGGVCGTPPGCSGLSPVEHGNMGNCRGNGTLRHGEACTMGCNPGYMMLGDQPRCGELTVGAVAMDFVCVPAECTDVPAPANGRLGSSFFTVQSGRVVDSTVTGTCTVVRWQTLLEFPTTVQLTLSRNTS